MHNIEIREKWDKNIKKSMMIKKNNRLAIIYILNKGTGIGFQQRDFYEKKISFKTIQPGDDEYKYYYYFSSLDSDAYPLKNDTIRSNIIVGFHKFEMIPET